MHLVGFIIEIYHNARSHERRNGGVLILPVIELRYLGGSAKTIVLFNHVLLSYRALTSFYAMLYVQIFLLVTITQDMM